MSSGNHAHDVSGQTNIPAIEVRGEIFTPTDLAALEVKSTPEAHLEAGNIALSLARATGPGETATRDLLNRAEANWTFSHVRQAEQSPEPDATALAAKTRLACAPLLRSIVCDGQAPPSQVIHDSRHDLLSVAFTLPGMKKPDMLMPKSYKLEVNRILTLSLLLRLGVQFEQQVSLVAVPAFIEDEAKRNSERTHIAVYKDLPDELRGKHAGEPTIAHKIQLLSYFRDSTTQPVPRNRKYLSVRSDLRDADDTRAPIPFRILRELVNEEVADLEDPNFPRLNRRSVKLLGILREDLQYEERDLTNPA